MKVLKYVLISICAIILCLAGVSLYIVMKYPNIPVQEISVKITPERVERGKYIAHHVAVCIDCHSTRDWTKYSGPIVPGTIGKGGERFDETMGFPGTYYSKNITQFNLSNWSDGEIFRAITSGVKKDGSVIFPVMPYQSYAKMDREDIYSIIAYIRSIPPIQGTTPESKSNFPMNIFINLIPEEVKLGETPNKSDTIAYGKYITTTAACHDCHTQFDKGKYKEEMAFAGGREFPMPFGTVSTANLTPDKATGIGNWTEAGFIKRFKDCDPDSNYKPISVKPDDFNSFMPWTQYAGMKREDLAAIYKYLRSLPPINNEVVKMKRKS